MRLALALVFLCCATPLVAQLDRARVDIAVTTAVQEGPSITTANLLADPNTRELLAHGFTAGLHFRLELWRKGGFFDDLDDRTTWDVLVSYDPTKQLYNVVRRQDQLLENFGGFSSPESAEGQFGQPYRVPLRPTRSGRYYYILTVDIRTLTESDLDALQQWLRGTSRSNPVSVVGKGIGKLLSRVLGGDVRQHKRQSDVIRVP